MCTRTMLEYLLPDCTQENKVYCYPVADESVAKDNAIPPARLVRLLNAYLICILMPRFGMALGISLPVLITGSLFCLLVMVLSVVLGRI
jgi:hypothetical protein